MKTNNVFEYQNLPVSILSDKGDAVIVINAKDEVFSIARSELKPSKLVTGGVYSEKFIQAALGGLVAPPVYKDRNSKEFKGVYGTIIAEPVSASHVKLSVGIPFKDLPQGMRPDHTGKGKVRRFENGAPSTLENPVGPKPKVPELQIGAGDDGNIIKKLTLEWNQPMDPIDVEEIRNMFGEDKLLPEPDRIKMQKGTEVETYQKQASAKSPYVKQASYYGLTPTMSRTCPKCASVMLIVTEKQKEGEDKKMSGFEPHGNDRVYTHCMICGYKELYEGSLPGQGVAGQTDHE